MHAVRIPLLPPIKRAGNRCWCLHGQHVRVCRHKGCMTSMRRLRQHTHHRDALGVIFCAAQSAYDPPHRQRWRRRTVTFGSYGVSGITRSSTSPAQSPCSPFRATSTPVPAGSLSESLDSKVVPSANTGALTPGGFKAAGGRAQARQAASPALPRTSSQG